MKIYVSKKAGYCMGVKRAFENSFKISNYLKNIVVFGEMVHNRFALQSLNEKGIKIEEDLNKILNNENFKNVIIRAHGIPPDQEFILKKYNKKIFDFTCPIVKKVQLLAKKLSDEGFELIITGKKTHPEIIGITGYCKTKYYVVKNLDEVKRIDFDRIKKIALISQTTMNSEMFYQILEYLKNRRKDLIYYNTLCNLPLKIQNEAIELAKKVDLMIVIGDKMSANTTTLYERINKITDTIFVETINDINFEKIKKYKKIGLTGGTSTPNFQIEQIKTILKSYFK